MRGSFALEAARPPDQSGRLYLYQDLIFLNERNQGLHIIDNRIPTAPVNVGFLRIPGNTEVAIRDNFLSACESSGSSRSGEGAVVTGTGGSTARMTISGDYLYAISGSRVQLFDISTPASPLPYTQVEVEWDIQTLFPHEEHLLVGAASGRDQWSTHR